MLRLLLCALLAGPAGAFASLPQPLSFSVEASGSSPLARWSPVPGAVLYRLAVFAPPDAEGKRELMAAVWLKTTQWRYGDPGPVVPKAGKLASTAPKPLRPGVEYRWMVAAARAGGLDRSDWTAADLRPEDAAVQRATPTPTSTPAPPADAQGGTLEAELEVDLAAEFKETPESVEPAASPVPTAALTPSFETARALLQSGRAEAAVQVYQALIGQDASNPDAWEGLGDAFDARKMRIEAKEAYEKALSLDPNRQRLKQWLEENVRR